MFVTALTTQSRSVKAAAECLSLANDASLSRMKPAPNDVEGQTEKLYTSEKQKTHRGRPFQSAYRACSVPTIICGYVQVNPSSIPQTAATELQSRFRRLCTQNVILWNRRLPSVCWGSPSCSPPINPIFLQNSNVPLKVLS